MLQASYLGTVRTSLWYCSGDIWRGEGLRLLDLGGWGEVARLAEQRLRCCLPFEGRQRACGESCCYL